MSSDTSRVRVFTALHDIAVVIGGVLEPVELARLVVNRARELLEAGAVGVYGLDEATQLLEPIYSSDAREALPEPAIPLTAIFIAIPAALVLANLIAAAPGQAAARTQPATILRTE